MTKNIRILSMLRLEDCKVSGCGSTGMCGAAIYHTVSNAVAPCRGSLKGFDLVVIGVACFLVLYRL